MSDSPDCALCPSFMTRDSAREYFGSDPGAPACRRFGHLLARPHMSEQDERVVRESFASKCSEFMKDVPIMQPVFTSSDVAYPDGDVLAKGSSDIATQPSNCLECKYSISASLSLSEGLWGLPLCTARGLVLFPQHVATVAEECQYGVIGTSPRHDLDDIVLKPLYEEAFKMVEQVRAGATSPGWIAGPQAPDPREYPTDRELTESDKRDGLRAWRKISDPQEYGEDVYWPVFDPEFIKAQDPIEYDKIPFTGSATAPELYVDWQGFTYQIAVMLTQLEFSPLLEGGAGTGKTEAAIHMAHLGNMPVRRIQVTAGMTLDDFAGSLRFLNQETVFRKGAFAYAYTRAGIVVLDEWNTADEEIRQSCRGVFDGSKSMSLEGASTVHPVTGELVIPEPLKQHPYNGVIACINDAHDYINTGVNELADADRSRLMHLRFEQPPEHIEREILTRHFSKGEHAPPSQALLDAVISIGREIRAHIEQGELEGMTWGMRSQIMAINATKFFPLPTAYLRAGGDYFERTKRETITRIVSSFTEGQNIR